MSSVTHEEIARLFPGIQDHTVVEILATKVTLDELEQALLLLANQDDELIDAKRGASGQLSRVLDILANAEIVQVEDRDR